MNELSSVITIFDMLMLNLVETLKITTSLHVLMKLYFTMMAAQVWRLKGCLGFFVQNDLDQSLQVYMQILRVEMMYRSAKQDAN